MTMNEERQEMNADDWTPNEATQRMIDRAAGGWLKWKAGDENRQAAQWDIV